MQPMIIYCGIVKLRHLRKALNFCQGINQGIPRGRMGGMSCAKGSSGGRLVVGARRHGFCSDT